MNNWKMKQEANSFTITSQVFPKKYIGLHLTVMFTNKLFCNCYVLQLGKLSKRDMKWKFMALNIWITR